MNIYITNCSNTLNYGSMMMGENFISYFNKISTQKNSFFIETTDNLNIQRLKEATNINEIYPVEMDALFKKNSANKYNYVLSYIGLKNIFSDLVKSLDLVVVLGGDDFTEDYGWKGPILNAIKLTLLVKRDIKVIMLGQTIGPYYSFRKIIMKRLLSKINKIYVRESMTFNYLKELGLRNISITDDLALLPLSKQTEENRSKIYITYCPSELIYKYTKAKNRSDWIEFNIFMINTILDNYPQKKIVLIAHVLEPAHVDDRIIVNELYELVKEKYSDRIILVNDAMYPYEVRRYIQQSILTITSRMHPAISSIQCEIPVIALSYSTKYWGILGERYDLRDYIIDVRFLSYDEMKHKFLSLIDKVELDYNNIQERMRTNNTLAKENIFRALEEIRDK